MGDMTGQERGLETLQHVLTHSRHSTPITTHQLESMIRLAQARAKCELREVRSREGRKEGISHLSHTRGFVTHTR